MTSNTQGVEFLRNPSVNKATAYSETEKQSLGLVGLVPDVTETIDTQLSRVLWQLQQKTSNLWSGIGGAPRGGDIVVYSTLRFYLP
jgi:malate dehydrogenase (oxaloacetate-decarboxylating)(NADP+)